MNLVKPITIELTEYKSVSFPRDAIPESAAVKLYQSYGKQVEIEFPNYKTGNKWRLKAQGWVGYIPLTPELRIALQPKVSIKNLFGMLEYAYKLKIDFPKGLIECKTIEDFFERLAYILAQLIIDRCRQGLYRTYLSKTEQFSYLRGKLNISHTIQKPWNVKFKCDYQQQTSDIEENQILAWTLFIICRSGLCSERVSPIVRKAYHTLQCFVTLKPFKAKDCIGRNYNRLNQDYILLHNFCRFFLENTAPSHEIGDRTMLPFLVNMAQLYELFVAEWLKKNPPEGFFVKAQHKIIIDQNRRFRIDLLLGDIKTGKIFYILDTKYKIPEIAADTDIHQMVSYATATKCYDAVLIYPEDLKKLLKVNIDNIQIRSLTFSLDKDLDLAGKEFLQHLLIPR